jgi:hypothetical protein
LLTKVGFAIFTVYRKYKQRGSANFPAPALTRAMRTELKMIYERSLESSHFEACVRDVARSLQVAEFDIALGLIQAAFSWPKRGPFYVNLRTQSADQH